MGVLISMGHRKIAYIPWKRFRRYERAYGQIFTGVWRRRGTPVEEDCVVQGEYYRSCSGCQGHKEALRLKNPPTCIIYTDDYACIGGMGAIEEAGLSIPDDISVAGYDGIPMSEVVKPRLTTVRQDTEQIGKRTVRKLVALIEKPKTTVRRASVFPLCWKKESR